MILRCYDNDAYNSNIHVLFCGIDTKSKFWKEHSVKESYVLWIVSEGTIKIQASGKEMILEKGDAYVFFPQTAYKAECLSEPCAIMFTHFNYQIAHNVRALEIYAIDDCFKYQTIKKQVNLYTDMIKQYSQNKSVSSLTLKGNLLLMLARLIELKGKKTVADGKHKKSISRLLPALDYIAENVHEHITIKMLANTVFCSEKYFSSLFKEAFGISPMKYIVDIKLNKALEYLSTKQHTIKDISASLGFADQFVFSKSFKRKFGLSPSAIFKTKEDKTNKQISIFDI